MWCWLWWCSTITTGRFNYHHSTLTTCWCTLNNLVKYKKRKTTKLSYLISTITAEPRRPTWCQCGSAASSYSGSLGCSGWTGPGRRSQGRPSWCPTGSKSWSWRRRTQKAWWRMCLIWTMTSGKWQNWQSTKSRYKGNNFLQAPELINRRMPPVKWVRWTFQQRVAWAGKPPWWDGEDQHGMENCYGKPPWWDDGERTEW